MTYRSRRPSPRLAYPFPPLDTPSQRALADALGKFLRAPDWLESLRVLLSHPVLLTEGVNNLLHEIADTSHLLGNIGDEVMMLTHLAFLEDVRRRGFFAVLNDLQRDR